MSEEIRTNDKENQLENYNNALKQSRAERLRQRDLAVFKEVINSKENEKVPEVVFANFFADYFKNFNENSDPGRLQQWVGLAGGYYNEVDLTNEKGEVVDTVPGFYKKLDLDNALDDINFVQTVVQYNRKRERLAVVAEEFAKESLKEAEKKVISDDATNAHEARWQAVINKYATQDSVTETKTQTETKLKIEPKTAERLQLDMDDD